MMSEIVSWAFQIARFIVLCLLLCLLLYPVCRILDGGGGEYPGGSHTQRDR